MSPTTAAKWRVLIVEDRPEDRELIEHELTKGKVAFESRATERRDEYLAALKEFKPDVVISDFALPQFDALEALSILRHYQPDIPFLLVTGAQSEEVAVECMKRGADDYILKSTLKRLPSAVLNALKKRETEHQKEKAEEDLRAQEEQYRLIAEHTRDLIYLLDAKGQFTYLSPSFQKTLGYAPEELIGKKAFSLLHPDDKTAARKAFQEALESRTGRTVPYRCKMKTGAWVLFESVVSWAFDDKGVPNKAVIVSRDIDERKRLEEQVRQAQKMEAVGRLAGGVAHDFNNLLTAITGYSDLLLRSLDRMDPRRADVEEIKETAARAATLTQQLLAFSRRQITQPTVLDLNHVVSNLEKMLRRLIGEDIQLRTVLTPHIHRVRADLGQIEQIVINLGVNSRDAMPEGGKLVIETANREIQAGEEATGDIPPGHYAVLSVTDTGCGMDPKTLNHLFEPFFTTKEKGHGTGLGLSTVYGIVQQSGGHIRVKSALGEGTTFWIYLPRVEDVVAPADKSSETDEFFKGNETVLLAEDDRTVRTLAVRILRQSGYRVLEASSGEEALRLLEESTTAIDLLVTDVVMNGISGPELAKRVNQKLPGVKILYLSGYMESDMRNDILKGVASSFLGKPFRPRDLVQRVRETLDGASIPGGDKK
ncbi:MAG TPA: response regulator [Elusimicrobiota bacterium]|nr:response regulator [Elusimicrobiota bacterium]HNG44837.1 response regulator [Elusimicrobiota bacterium]